MAKQEKKTTDIVRIMGTDINSDMSLLYGLSKIKGVGYMFANALCVSLKYDKNIKISALSEKDIDKIEEYLAKPEKAGIPAWLINQRNNLLTGEDLHFAGKELEFHELQLRRRLFKTRNYRGTRIKNRLTVRGQRTKANFRRNKTIAAMKSKTGGRK